MKKTLPIVAICLAFALSGCHKLAMLSDTLAVDTLALADSVMFTQTNKARVRITCQYPVGGNPLLTDSISAWIASCLDAESADTVCDIPALARKNLRDTLAGDSTEMASMIDTDGEMPDYFYYDHDCDIRIVYEDDDYVTFCQTLYSFMGGAHGSTSYDYTTFCKSGPDTGRRMGWNLLAGYNPNDLRMRIEEGLAEYFDLGRNDHLRDFLFVEEHDEIPFPQSAPFLTKEGVCVIYQEYEICPYAMGSPLVVVRHADDE